MLDFDPVREVGHHLEFELRAEPPGNGDVVAGDGDDWALTDEGCYAQPHLSVFFGYCREWRFPEEIFRPVGPLICHFSSVKNFAEMDKPLEGVVLVYQAPVDVVHGFVGVVAHRARLLPVTLVG